MGAKSDFERAFILDKLQENQWNVPTAAGAPIRFID